MSASVNRMAGSFPAYFSSPAATAPVSTKFPASGWPENISAAKPIMATAPIITKAMPIQRSRRSYLMKRGVMRLSTT
jgi:hypothetical protein